VKDDYCEYNFRGLYA